MKIKKGFLAVFSVVLLFVIVSIIAQSSWWQGVDYMSLAISLDLLLVIPLLYFLLIRKSAIPNTTVVPIMLLGLLLGFLFLPEKDQFYLAYFKSWVLPFIELFILSYVVIKVRSARKSFKSTRKGNSDFYVALVETCKEILPRKLVYPFASEVAVFYYGFFHWKKVRLNAQSFSYHKNTATQALLGALLFVIAIETVVLHVLIIRWSEMFAMVLSILSVYSAFQVFGVIKSLSKRPIILKNDILYLNYGILSNSEVLLKDIEGIELYKKDLDKKNKGIYKLSPLGEMEDHNILIHFKKKQSSRSLYGTKKEFSKLVLFVDEPKDFIQCIESLIKNYT